MNTQQEIEFDFFHKSIKKKKFVSFNKFLLLLFFITFFFMISFFKEQEAKIITLEAQAQQHSLSQSPNRTAEFLAEQQMQVAMQPTTQFSKNKMQKMNSLTDDSSLSQSINKQSYQKLNSTQKQQIEEIEKQSSNLLQNLDSKTQH